MKFLFLLCFIAFWVQGEELLKMELQTVSQKPLATGSNHSCNLILENISSRIVVIKSVSLPGISGTKEISFLAKQYGSMHKGTDGNFYHNSMAQQETRIPLCYGLIYPKKKQVVPCEIFMIEMEGKIEITFCASEKPYDGSFASLSPLEIYTIQKDPKDDNAGFNFEIVYKPATKQSLENIRHVEETNIHVEMVGSERSHVLVGNIDEIPDQKASLVVKAKDELPFPLKTARKIAQDIMLRENFALYYSPALHGFLVAPENKNIPCWLLKDAKQKNKGKLYPHDISCVLELLENPCDARLRVGEKQSGFGPESHPADYKFWDRWDVSYGDGMYTRGEFIQVKKEEWTSLLTLIVEKKTRISKHFYYFGSFYYELEFSK